MEKYTFLAVILVYRNYNDLIECVDSMYEKIKSCKIIVVNSYYDDESMNEIKKVADEHNCDFINIENRGYSYGNNVGIEFARTHYEYDYIIISNPDILIKSFSTERLAEDIICAPRITSKAGKEQNPMVIRRNKISEYLIYKGFKKESRFYLLCGFASSKIYNTLNKLFKGSFYKVYQAHGSFIILHRNVIEKIAPIFDDNMFLFGEEGLLALKAKENGIETFYNSDISIFHKEDGSMSLADFSINEELSKANIYFYEKYTKKK